MDVTENPTNEDIREARDGAEQAEHEPQASQSPSVPEAVADSTDNEVPAESGETASDEASEPAVYDYEAERAKKLAFRASLTEEDIARMRKHEKPANYAFGRKIVEGVEGTSASGYADERERSALEIERDQRIEQAARVDDWQGKLDAMSHEERVAATLDCLGRRPAFARVLRAVLEYCREERNSEDVEAYIETLQDFAANRQSPRRYVFFLMRTGALSEVGYDADGNMVDERSVQTVHDELNPQPAPDTDADRETAEDEALEQVESVEACEIDAEEVCGEEELGEEAITAAEEPTAENEVAVSEEEAVDDEAPLETDEAPVDPLDTIVEWRVVTTAAGLEALEATDARGQLRTLLAAQAEHRYAAYLDVLTFCEEPRTMAEISEFLIDNPGLEIDDRGVVNMQPNAYIGKLDKAGALVWSGSGWQTTKEALEVLDTL